MVIWNDKMIVTESVQQNLKKIKKKIEKPAKLKFGAHIITLSNSGKDLFDIYNILYFPGKHFNKEGYDVNVIGITKDHDEAIELVTGLLDSIYAEYGDVSAKRAYDYFEVEFSDK